MSPDPTPIGPKGRPTGFTLIELLVVIFIISLLAALTLTIVPKVKRAVYGAETQAQLSALSNAIQQYYNDYKAYPGPLANNQLNWLADSIPANIPTADGSQLGATATPYNGVVTQYDPPTTGIYQVITGSQNLVLGLLGGLELVKGPTAYNFVYNANDIFSDGVTPAPRGPASLNVTNPKRQQAYIQVKAGDLSTPNNTYNSGNGASFADSANRSPADAMIPVFLDKYADPLPILYYRTNVGGTAIVGFRNLDGIGGSPLKDSTLTPAPLEVAQYDLWQNYAYTNSAIGTNTGNPSSIHGLHGLGTAANLSDPIDTNANGTYTPSNAGSNGIAYFKDPTLNPPYDPTVATPPSNTHLGVARQKDGYLLISAGPDRLYGTHDDLVFPGPLLP